METKLTTGVPGLDKVLTGLLPGDNVVWQVDSIDDYRAVVAPYAEASLRAGRPLIYFRFASHPPLLGQAFGAVIHELRPQDGFETFVARIHGVIEKAGRGAFYVFDCLSELAVDWYSDQMLGNFFMLTCPYLFDLETIAYFSLYRGHHSSHALMPIMNTTQLFLEIYRYQGALYIRPLKVQHRYSSTMNMLHVWRGRDLRPVSSSAVISEILATDKWAGLHNDERPGFWQQNFLEAQEVLDLIKYGQCPPQTEAALFQRLARMVMSRDERILHLIEHSLTLADILEIRKRMIGTGLIGGKTVGMLLARAILQKEDARFTKILEKHDSFYIGSDVFYTFLVRNGIWWIRQKQRDSKAFLEGAEQARQRMLTGVFPDYVLRQFEELLHYFGQSPFIVRSSSLLEDNYGNSFAGKYESVFCANQGPQERRLEDFLAAVRTIYASTMSEKALQYRADRKMLDQDEQMALLVMRVSGSMHGRKYFPALAGVGFSYNPYAWHADIDPKAGVSRLVFGLGTRAVNRSDDDYTRIVAMNAPDKRPEANFDEVRQYAQRQVDYIDLDANHLMSGYFSDLVQDCGDLPLDLLLTGEQGSSSGRIDLTGVVTFDRLLADTEFVTDLREMLRILQQAYDYPVDVEFTVNFTEDRGYLINLVQCRPLQVQGADMVALPTVQIATQDRIIEARSAVIGQSRLSKIDWFIYVSPAQYGGLPIQERHEVASLLGELNRVINPDRTLTVMLLGPGRWGTSTPSLGIPVSFPQINRVSILCEIVAMRKDLIPDVSLGTHFLNELVEMDMLYLALYPKQRDNYINTEFFEGAPNHLLQLVPESDRWVDTVRVISAKDAAFAGRGICLLANALEQRVDCYFDSFGS